MEFAFPFFLNKLPLKVFSILESGEQILGQTSKKSVLPKNYVAIVGDSYAAGWGDWKRQQVENNWLSRPDYQLTHLFHRKKNIDVVTFGVPGGGSVAAAIELAASFNYINSLRNYSLERPQSILVYFYEGNDVYNNIMDTLWSFKEKHHINDLQDRLFFKKFINEFYLQRHPLMQNNIFLKDLIFTKFVISLFKESWKSIKIKVKSFSKRSLERLQSSDFLDPNINKILVGGRQIQLPKTVQGPPFVGIPKSDVLANIKEENFNQAIYIFEQSLTLLKSIFKGSLINVVYIPSPLAVYKIVSPTVVYDHWTETPDNIKKPYYKVDSSLIAHKSYELCKIIESKARKLNLAFLDTKIFLREVAVDQMIHGPKDFGHFNKKGYETLLKGILEAFYENKSQQKNFHCKQ